MPPYFDLYIPLLYLFTLYPKLFSTLTLICTTLHPHLLTHLTNPYILISYSSYISFPPLYSINPFFPFPLSINYLSISHIPYALLPLPHSLPYTFHYHLIYTLHCFHVTSTTSIRAHPPPPTDSFHTTTYPTAYVPLLPTLPPMSPLRPTLPSKPHYDLPYRLSPTTTYLIAYDLPYHLCPPMTYLTSYVSLRPTLPPMSPLRLTIPSKPHYDLPYCLCPPMTYLTSYVPLRPTLPTMSPLLPTLPSKPHYVLPYRLSPTMTYLTV